jgi:hypothetical protein
MAGVDKFVNGFVKGMWLIGGMHGGKAVTIFKIITVSRVTSLRST